LVTHASLRQVSLVILIASLNLTLAAQQPVFRSGVKLIEATVVVHDRSGKPVSDLKASDFRIFEDGKEQKLEFFAVEGAQPADQSVRSFPLPKNVYSNRVEERLGGGVTAILLDRLNSRVEDQKFARDQLVKFLLTLKAEDRVALYVLESDAIKVLHEFTSDPRSLVASLNRRLTDSSVELTRSEELAPDFAPTGLASLDADTAGWLTRTMENVSEMYLIRRAQLAVNALETVANHLQSMPGRKNLIWISGGFPVVIPTAHGPEIMDRDINRALRAVNGADIAVYAVDIRGLAPALNPTTATATIAMPTFGARGAAPPPPQGFNNVSTVTTNQDVMHQAANATGGRAYTNNNAIGDMVRRAMDDGRVSYVLGYYSPREKPDGKFHQVEVKVGRSNVDVRHRKGYLALPPPPRRDPKTRLAALDRVMQSPAAATALPVMAQLDRTADDEATVIVRVDPESLTWEQQKDIREGAIDIVIALSDSDGGYFKVKETTVNLSADADRYKQMVAEGFTLSSAVKLRPTASRLHVIVSDVASQAVGSLIIPLQR
jgi:VWFA-related protein